MRGLTFCAYAVLDLGDSGRREQSSADPIAGEFMGC